MIRKMRALLFRLPWLFHALSVVRQDSTTRGDVAEGLAADLLHPARTLMPAVAVT